MSRDSFPHVPAGDPSFRSALACRIGLPAAFVLSLVTGGCSSVAPTDPGAVDFAVPARWSTAEPASTVASASLVDWWSRFDDPLLTRFVDDAMRANSTVRSARGALRQARALRDVAAAALLPSVSATASGQRSGSNVAGAGRNVFQAGLDASWEVDVFGFNRDALSAAEATARGSDASLGDVRVSIAAEVALDYIAVRGLQSRLAIAAENVASQQETLQITEWRREAGLVTAVEAAQARAATELTRALLPALQTGIDQSRHALAVLTGQPPAALDDALRADAPVPRANGDPVPNVPADTLRQRPDVRAAAHAVDAATALVAQAEAARLPSFAVAGSLGWSAAALGALTDGASIVRAIVASAAAPLFDGGALRARVDAQQAVLDQARSAYQATVLVALKDVEDALSALGNDRTRLASLQSASEAAANASSYARQRFASGLIDFQVVLETQRTQLSAQDGVASANADLSADQVRLYKALGGGWDGDRVPVARSDRAAPSRVAGS